MTSDSSTTQDVVGRVWAEVLGVHRVRPEENFFDLGGDSLRAVLAVSRLLQLFGGELLDDRSQLEGRLLKAIFSEPTIACTARVLESMTGPSPRFCAPQVRPPIQGQAVRLSYSQELWWYAQQLDPGTACFNIFSAFRLLGRLNVAALRRSFEALVDRHESLRTTFSITGDGVPVQNVTALLTPVVVETDLGTGPDTDVDARVQSLISEEWALPFNLRSGPPLRARLGTLNAEYHVLLVSLHHIAADGWSMSIFFRELAGLYEAFARENEPRLQPLPFRYVDFAVWQRESLTGPRLESLIGYWSRQVPTNGEVLELPIDHPRGRGVPFQTSTRHFTVPRAIVDSLRVLSRQEGATLFMTLLAAFEVLLHRYSRQVVFAFGTPSAGRDWIDTEDMIGAFVNTLVIRADLSSDPTFVQLLRRVRDVAVGAYANRALPFSKLVEVLRPERTEERTPWLRAMIVFQNVPPATLSLTNLTVERLAWSIGTGMFDLTLSLSDVSDGLAAEMHYDSALLDPETIGRMAEHFVTLLRALSNDPNVPISRIPLLPTAELNRLLFEWNSTSADLPGETVTLQRIFEQQATVTPDATALLWNKQHVTFRTLNIRANRLARYLCRLGVQSEDLVGVHLPRSVDLVACLLGILKAGGVYVPLSLDDPRGRLEHILKDAQPKVVVTCQSLVRQLSSYGGGRTVCLDDSAVEAEDPEDLGVESGPNSPAYVMYTSGSAGAPRGVVALQRGAINRLQWMWTTFPFGPDEVLCCRTSIGFVDSVWEIFGPLLRGVPLVLLSDAEAKDPTALLRTLRHLKVTRIVVVPSLLSAILDTDDNLDSSLSDLRIWTCSGEALSAALARRFRSALPHRLLINLYGSTEVSADVTFHEVDASPEDHGSLPIGRPISNTLVYVLDEQLQPVPIGVSAELFVGGEGLAKEYLHNAELTAAKFIANPYSRQYGGRLYRTGDRVRILPNGMLQFVGRMDRQAKIRGFRVEPAEIEAALQQHASVRQCVVLPRGDDAKGQYMAAYVVPRSGMAASEYELRRFVKDRLPGYMHPATIAFVPTVPLTSSGKVDQHALYPMMRSRDGRHVGPRNVVERSIVAIWQELLRLNEVGIYDSFFDLGGHSLLAIQVVARVKKTFHVDIPVGAVVTAGTVADLASLIIEKQMELFDQQALTQMVDEIKGLSTDEVRDFLAAERRGADRGKPE